MFRFVPKGTYFTRCCLKMDKTPFPREHPIVPVADPFRLPLGNVTPMRSGQSNLYQTCHALIQPSPALTLSALRESNAMHSSQ